MPAVVPHSFLFRYAIPVNRVDDIPASDDALVPLDRATEVPFFGGLDGHAPFASVHVAWNDNGVGIAMNIQGKTNQLRSNRAMPTEADGLQVWIDTRNTQSIHRASRFCHHFCFVATGGGPKKDQPYAQQLQIARAREESKIAASNDIPVRIQQGTDSYRLEAWLPAGVLTGYEPEANPALGFFYHVRDAQLGDQYLSVDRDFPFATDPSVWSTLQLETLG